MRNRLLVALCAVGLGLAAPAFAQRTTGNLVGTVTDDTGAVLPGVTVLLEGENIVGTQTSITNEKGFYRFVALPPGQYDIEFRMTGFTNVHHHQVTVSLGETAEDDVQLKISKLSEEVTVTGEADVVDTSGDAVSTNYDKDWVRNAPIARFTFFDLINAAPGVYQSSSNDSRSTSFGSGADENSYQLDGTDFTAPFTGAAWPWPNTDAIQEIQVLSLGAPAEYGNVSGAVFNVVTRQGTNVWHGDLNYYSQYDALTSDNTTNFKLPDGSFLDTCPSGEGRCPYHRKKYQDFTVQLGGPIIKDKLWFLGSYQYQRDYQSQPGVDPLFPTRQENDRIFFKLNWQINSKNKVMFALHNDYYYLPYDQGANDAPSTVGVEHGNNPSPNITYTGVLSDKTYVEVRFSGFFGKDHADPLNGGPRVAPRFYNLDTGQITGGTYYWYDNDVFREGAAAKISHFADDFLGGSHDFKFGVQYFRGGSNNGRYGANDFIYTYNYYGTEYAYGYTYEPQTYGGIVNGLGVFGDDTFRVNDRLTLNLGVRYDWQRASVPGRVAVDASQRESLANGSAPQGAAVPAISDLFTWNSVSPRLGFNLRLTDDGKTVLKGHYGRYYRMMVSGEYTFPFASPSRGFAGPYDLTTGQFTDLTQFFETGTNYGVDPNYSNPYTDQFIVALERQLARNLGISLNYTYKRGRDYPRWKDTAGSYDTVNYIDNQGADATGATIPVQRLLSDPGSRFFQITNSDEMKTDIHAFTAQLVKKMSSHWEATVSLTYLHSRGLLPSGRGGPSSSQYTSLRFSNFGQNPNDLVNTGGVLIGDRPWGVKCQLVYEAPAGFLLGANYVFQTGRPWNRQVRVPDLGLVTTINAEVRDGSRRVSNWNNLDLRIQKKFPVGKEAGISLFADILNVFNDNTNEDVLSQLGTSDSFGVPSQIFLPRRLMVGGKITF